MADLIGFTKEQLHSIYEQVTVPQGSETRIEATTGTAVGPGPEGTTGPAREPNADGAATSSLASCKEDSTGLASGPREQTTVSSDPPAPKATTDSAATPRNEEFGTAMIMGNPRTMPFQTRKPPYQTSQHQLQIVQHAPAPSLPIKTHSTSMALQQRFLDHAVKVSQMQRPRHPLRLRGHLILRTRRSPWIEHTSRSSRWRRRSHRRHRSYRF